MKSVRDVSVTGKRVMVRVDYNVPMDENENITDDNRIKATLPLTEYLQKRGARTILISHMGRPGGKIVARLSLAPLAKRLSRMLGRPVEFVEDCIGKTLQEKVAQLNNGDVILLENLRFYSQEEDCDPDFAEKLASMCDVYVNEAFAVSHRDQASVTGIPKYVSVAVAGFLLEKELNSYYDSVENPVRPLVAIIGGAKVSGKLEALKNMLNFVDSLIIGGAMANTFLKSQGVDTKGSMIEEALVETAAEIVHAARERNIEVCLPNDLVVAQKFHKDAEKKEVALDKIPDGWMAMDIGPKTAAHFARRIQDAGTIVWNGPMGVFEMPAFMTGTKRVADAVASAPAFSVVGGGDTGLAVNMCGAAEKISYISTGGGAFLHLMEGRELPGITALK